MSKKALHAGSCRAADNASLSPRAPSGLFVSVDVDCLDLYLSLYGRTCSDGQRIDLVEKTYSVGVARFLELFDELGLKSTFFVVGRDLDAPGARRTAMEAVAAGHSLGNHTYSHRYDLIRLPDEDAEAEIRKGHDAIAALCAQTGANPAVSPQDLLRHAASPHSAPAFPSPTIFRAPGYNMEEREYGLLAAIGYKYDASPLPSPPYLALKYAVMLGLLATGKRSHSIWGSPAAFVGARLPYQRRGLWVLPNASTPVLRLPVIGTSLSSAPEPLFDHMLSAISRDPFVSIEFHAVDLLELDADALPSELSSQKDLSIPVSRKRARFRKFLESLAKTREPFVP